MKRAALLFMALALAVGCAMPATSVRSVDSRPSISLKNAWDGAELYVDGIRMGWAADFEEPNRLNLEPGTHRVAIVEKGATVLQQTIFVESEHKTITAR